MMCKFKWGKNIVMQPIYVNEFVILLHLIWELVFITFIIGKHILLELYICRLLDCNVHVSPSIEKHSQNPKQGHAHMYY
jgi:hypothetical protein